MEGGSGNPHQSGSLRKDKEEREERRERGLGDGVGLASVLK